MQAAQNIQAVSEALFGRRFLAYCQANPSAATAVMETLVDRNDQMARSLAATIKQSVADSEECI